MDRRDGGGDHHLGADLCDLAHQRRPRLSLELAKRLALSRQDRSGHGQWQPNILLQGLATTLRLAFYGILIAGVIGAITGVMRTSRRPALRLIAGGYVMLVRNIPPVVFVFIFAFFIASQVMRR